MILQYFLLRFFYCWPQHKLKIHGIPLEEQGKQKPELKLNSDENDIMKKKSEKNSDLSSDFPTIFIKKEADIEEDNNQSSKNDTETSEEQNPDGGKINHCKNYQKVALPRTTRN